MFAITAWAGHCRQYGRSSLELVANWALWLYSPLVIGAEAPEQTMQIAQILSSFDRRNHDVSIMLELEMETVITPSLWRQ